MDTTVARGGSAPAHAIQPHLPLRPARPAPGIVRLEQLTRVLRRHLWLIGLCGAVGGAAAFAYAHTLPKQYTATSLFTVEGDRFAIPELQGALRADSSPDPMPWVRTEVQALTSRVLVRQVADRLRLAEMPEFNPALRPPTLEEQVKAWVGARIGPMLPAGPADAPPSGPDEAVLNSANKVLGVFQDNRSLVISVFFTAQDPRLAAAFVNDLVADYVHSRAQRRVDANQGANEALTDRIDAARKDLAAIEAEIAALRDSSGLVDVRAGTVGQQQLEELTTAAARATLERSQLEVSYERAAAAAKGGSSDALASVLNSPTVSHLRDGEAVAQRRVADLSTRYGADYPAVRSASAELATARRQIAEEAGRIVTSLGAQLRVARAQEADVKQQLAAAQRTGVEAEATRAKLVQMQQEAATRRSLYQTLLERSQQTVVQPANLSTPDVRILSPAVPPGSPSGPRTAVAGLLGAASGGVLGILLALTRMQKADALLSEDDVTALTGLPVLATVPARLLAQDKAATSRQRADTMRTVRERLRFAGRGSRPRIVVIGPARPGAASSAAIATALARTAAADGEHVLLMEPEPAGPAVSRTLGMRPSGAGSLPEAMAAEDWHDTLQTDGMSGLQVMPGGRKGDGADRHALLRRPQFHNLLLEARDEFDLIVLHVAATTGPVAATLAQQADLVVLVIEAGTRQAAVDEAARVSDVAHAPVTAVLVTQA